VLSEGLAVDQPSYRGDKKKIDVPKKAAEAYKKSSNNSELFKK